MNGIPESASQRDGWVDGLTCDRSDVMPTPRAAVPFFTQDGAITVGSHGYEVWRGGPPYVAGAGLQAGAGGWGVHLILQGF